MGARMCERRGDGMGERRGERMCQDGMIGQLRMCHHTDNKQSQDHKVTSPQSATAMMASIHPPVHSPVHSSTYLIMQEH